MIKTYHQETILTKEQFNLTHWLTDLKWIQELKCNLIIPILPTLCFMLEANTKQGTRHSKLSNMKKMSILWDHECGIKAALQWCLWFAFAFVAFVKLLESVVDSYLNVGLNALMHLGCRVEELELQI